MSIKIILIEDVSIIQLKPNNLFSNDFIIYVFIQIK